MNPILKKVYKDIGIKYGLTTSEVEKIVRHQFSFVRQVMAQGEKNNPDTFKTIQLTHLGKFAVREYKLKEFQKKASGKK
jgi:nucleoid DNA-binding protein